MPDGLRRRRPFDLNAFEKTYSDLRRQLDQLAEPSALQRTRAASELDRRLLAEAEAGRLRSLAELQQRSLEERRTIANGGDFDLHIQAFTRGALPGRPPSSPVPVFQRPTGVVRRDTKATLVIDDPAQVSRQYTQEFILTQVDREAKERWQLLATFGGFDLSLYGSDPVVFSCQGHIYDGAEVATDWYNRFWELYEGSLLGSVATRDGRSVYLYYSGRIVHGVMLKLSVSQKADPGHLVDFSWVMLVLSDTQIAAPTLSDDPARNVSQGAGSPALSISDGPVGDPQLA